VINICDKFHSNIYTKYRGVMSCEICVNIQTTDRWTDSQNTLCLRRNNANYKATTPFKVIQGHRFWYQSKAHMRLPISD